MALAVAGAYVLTAASAVYAADVFAHDLTTAAALAWVWFASLGWLVILLLLLRLETDADEPYYRPTRLESDGRLYERLGVRAFGRFMVGGEYANRIVRRIRPSVRPVRGRTSLAAFARRTRSKEMGHLLHLLMTVPVLVLAVAVGSYGGAIAVLILDVLVDLYPIMPQRYNRIRIGRRTPVA